MRRTKLSPLPKRLAVAVTAAVAGAGLAVATASGTPVAGGPVAPLFPTVTGGDGSGGGEDLLVEDLDRDGAEDVVVVLPRLRQNFTTQGGFGVLRGRAGSRTLVPADAGTQVADGIADAALADLDGDGRQDLVLAGAAGAPVRLGVRLGLGDGGFAPGVGADLPGPASAVVVGDVDHDAQPDAVVAHPGLETTSLLRGGGTDGALFQPAQALTFGLGVADVLLGDLDRDGWDDLVLLRDDGVTLAEVHLNQRDGTFGLAADTVPGGPAASARLDDADRDGDLDVVASLADGGVAVLEGDGTGRLTARDAADGLATDGAVLADLDRDGAEELAWTDTAIDQLEIAGGEPLQLPDGPRDLQAADVDDDGREDLVVSQGADLRPVAVVPNLSGVVAPNAWSAPVGRDAADGVREPRLADVDRDGRDDVVALATGGAVVVPGAGGAALPVDLGGDVSSVAVGDLDRDGRLDLAGTLPDDGRVVVAYGTGDGRFADPDALAAGTAPTAVAIGDVDGDARPDLVVADGGGEGVALHAQAADGTFAPPVTIGGAAHRDVAIADVDADGARDVVTLDRGTTSFTVFRNLRGSWLADTTATAASAEPAGRLRLADVDGDGRLDAVYALEEHLEEGDGSSVLRGGAEVAYGLEDGSAVDVRPLPGDDVLSGVDVADVSRDGLLDVVGAGRDPDGGGPRLSVTRQTSRRAFAAVRTAPAGTGATGGLVLGDRGRDGFADAQVAVPGAAVLRELRAVDDQAAPVVAFAPAPPARVRPGTLAVRYDVRDASPVEVVCRLDGDPVACGPTGVDLDLTTAGTVELDVSATDALGRTTSLVRTIEVDGTAPAVAIDAEPAYGTAAPSFPFTVDDAGATVRCAVDGGTPRPCSSPFTASGLDEGPGHELAVVATDDVGNTTTETVGFAVDLTPPALALRDGPSGRRNAASETFTFDAEAGATLTCTLDGAAVAGCDPAGTTVAVPAPDGLKVFSVRAVDAVGNAAEVTRAWTRDTLAPDAPAIAGAPTGTVRTTSATLDLTAPEPGAALSCAVDGGDPVACGPRLALRGLDDGARTVAVVATDAAGNASDPATASWVVDTVAPSLTLTGAPSGRRRNATEALTFTAGPDAGPPTCLRGTVVLSSCASGAPIAVTAGGDGPKTLTVRVADAAGNVREASASWVLDRAAPVVAVTGGPSGATSATSAAFTLDAEDDDPSVALRCAVDDGPAEPCAATRTLTGLRDGAHELTVTATDTAGNAATPVTRSWTVDTLRPTARIVSGPSGPQASDAATFAVEGDEGTTLECRLDGEVRPCGAPLTGLAEGPHGYAVVAVDAAGNRSEEAVQTFEVDRTAPPAAQVARDGSTFTLGGGEPGARYECAVDGGAPAPCTSPASFPGLPPGDHTLSVVTLDAAGNRSAPVVTTWRIAAPVVAQSPPPAAPPAQDPPPAAPPAEPPPPAAPGPVFQQTVAIGQTVKACFTPPGGKRCVPLTPGVLIPVGSVIDTTAKGAYVDLTSAAPDGSQQSARFYEGLFRVGQISGPTGQITELTLVGKLVCPKPKASARVRSAAAKKKKVTRRLWGDGKGAFRTKGRYGAATVRGTKWKVEDLCEGTKVTVAVGVVDVLDLVRKKTSILRAGQNRLIRPK